MVGIVEKIKGKKEKSVERVAYRVDSCFRRNDRNIAGKAIKSAGSWKGKWGNCKKF